MFFVVKFRSMPNGQFKRYFPGDEKDPPRAALSKRFLPKIMITSCLARPRPEYGFNGLVHLRRRWEGGGMEVGSGCRGWARVKRRWKGGGMEV